MTEEPLHQPYTPPQRERREPRLLQRKNNGFWFVRFRHQAKTKDKAIGMSTTVLEEGAMPENPSKYVFEHDQWVPRRVFDKYVNEYKLPYLRGTYNPWDEESDLLVSEAIDLFLKQFEEGSNTYRSYKGVLYRFRDQLENPHAKLKNLDADQIEDFLSLSSLKSAASKKSYWRQLRAFYNWTLKEGFIKPSIHLFKEIKKPAASAKAEFPFYTPDDYEAVIKEVKNDYHQKKWRFGDSRRIIWIVPIWDLAVSTGLRKAELEQLQWQDIRKELGTLEIRSKTIEHDGIKFIPKGKRSRRVQILSRAETTLKELRKENPESGPLDFVLPAPDRNPDGTTMPMNGEKASAKWRHYRHLAGTCRDLSFHGLRHLFVTYMLLLDYSIFYVQNVAGHADIQTTQRYAHFTKSLVSSKVREKFQKRLIVFGFDPPSDFNK